MNIAELGIAVVPVITVIVFLVAETIKATPLDNKWLPVICGFVGGLLGLAAVFLMPDFPAGDYMTAVAIGIVSGLAATGAHQVYKQLTKTEVVEDTPSQPSGQAEGEEDNHVYTADEIIEEINNE